MPDYVEDWTAFREQQHREVEAANMTREQMLAEMKELLGGITEMLPNYRHFKEAALYQMTIEDIDDIELLYSRYVKDDAGIVEDSDIIDALVQARVKYRLVLETIEKAVRKDKRST